MTGEKRMFSSYEKNQDPQRAITFGDGNQGLVKGLGKIAISPDHSISNVFLVDSLDYNLISVSQLCKMGYNCLFTDIGVTVFRRSDDSVAFKGVLEGQLYLVDFDRAELDTCLIAKTNMGRLWHRRLAHVLGRRRRRHPSLDAFADLAGSMEARRRADSPFVSHVAGRRPVTKSHTSPDEDL
jgi:hypothetical protein